MHEFAICESLLTQAARIAAENGAARVERITVSIGPLSGVEACLLERAFTLAREAAGFPTAELEIETPSVKVDCTSCGAQSEATANRLVCAACGDWRVSVVSGAEMILKSVELSGLPAPTVH